MKIKITWLLYFVILCFSNLLAQEKINRFALVTRHNPAIYQNDSMTPLTIGNGEFAFTADITGLQTFPDFYAQGIYLGTQSQWGWHTIPDTMNYQLSETYRYFDNYGRKVPYPYSQNAGRAKDATNWLRANPHRLHLGTTGFVLHNADGTEATIGEIKVIKQTLDLWTGVLTSAFVLEGDTVRVTTCCHPLLDMVTVKITSKLIQKKRLQVVFRFAYPSDLWNGMAANKPNANHLSKIEKHLPKFVSIHRKIDEAEYFLNLYLQSKAKLERKTAHEFLLSPNSTDEDFTFSFCYTPEKNNKQIPEFDQTIDASKKSWKSFWETGGIVDLSQSTDLRANELERRIVLSQYLTKTQCSGKYPPQETGLTVNSWFGKFHLEMHWWHAAHFALWNRTELLENSLGWYSSILPKARNTARLQAYNGARFPKMTDPSGNESPSPIGPLLVWQQPHIIYFAELCYRNFPTEQTLEKYKTLVFEAADFMASYPNFDSINHRYVLGAPIIPAQETFPPETTYNPAFELVYWKWALGVAQLWRERLGLAKNQDWEKVYLNLSQLAIKDQKYLPAESATDAYQNEKYMTDHPIVMGVLGFLPETGMVDTAVLKNTVYYIKDHWYWNDTWGWDYPLAAMCATRLGLPDLAIDFLLLDTPKNHYSLVGHNYQRKDLHLYLPANGGLLAAIALMTAGWDGNKTENPGFPKDSKWVVKWEDINSFP